MAAKRAPANAGSAGGAGDPISNLLVRILDFLDRKFGNLSPRLRAVAYFALLGLFCATTWRIAAGQHVVHGVIWRGESVATDCEVRVGTDFFSTNSKGMYYAVLSPSQYYRFVAASEVALPLSCRTKVRVKEGEREVEKDGEMVSAPGPFTVRLNWWQDELTDISLGAPAAQKASEEPAPFSFSLSAAAFAQPPPKPPQPEPASPVSAPVLLPSKGDRLVVERVLLGGSARTMRRVEFEIDLGEEERPLLLRGDEVGKLPMKPTVAFGETYYFDVPEARQGKKASIEMEATGLFGPEEKFKFRMPNQYNALFRVPGSMGSTIELRLVPRAPAPR